MVPAALRISTAPLRFELNPVRLFGTELDTHTQTGTAARLLFDGSAIIVVWETFALVKCSKFLFLARHVCTWKTIASDQVGPQLEDRQTEMRTTSRISTRTHREFATIKLIRKK